MKKIYILLLLACAPFFINAQCFVQVQHTNELCFGDCNATAQAFPAGQAPYSYNWAPGNLATASVSGLCAGTYTVTVTDANNCVSTSSFTVTQPTQIVVITSPTNASCQSCCDGFITSNVVGGTPGYTFQWNTSPVQTTQAAQGVCPGTYTLCVTDMNGCSTCSSATVNFSTGIAVDVVNENLDVYPNPTADVVTVKENFEKAVSPVITVTNILGETILTRSLSQVIEMNETINLSGLDAGIYFVAVKTAAGTSTKRIMKE